MDGAHSSHQSNPPRPTLRMNRVGTNTSPPHPSPLLPHPSFSAQTRNGPVARPGPQRSAIILLLCFTAISLRRVSLPFPLKGSASSMPFVPYARRRSVGGGWRRPQRRQTRNPTRSSAVHDSTHDSAVKAVGNTNNRYYILHVSSAPAVWQPMGRARRKTLPVPAACSAVQTRLDAMR